MNKKAILATVFVLLFMAAVGTVSAQVSIGISEGDSFTYLVTSNSNVPLIYGVVNSPKDVQNLTITVQDLIQPKAATLNITQQFKNGTKSSLLQDKDFTSALNFPMTFANLNVGDALWSSENLSPKVNDTVTNNSRQINHAFVGSSESGYDLVDYSFDKQTGMPTQIRYIESNEVSTTLTLINTNLWTIPEFSNIALLFLIVFMSIGAAIAAYKRKTN